MIFAYNYIRSEIALYGILNNLSLKKLITEHDLHTVVYKSRKPIDARDKVTEARNYPILSY